MKSFKEFIFESIQPKEYEVISNSHGAHASIDKPSKQLTKDAKEYEVISNSHGAHASIKTKSGICEEINPESGSFESKFLAGIHGTANHRNHKSNMEDTISKLHDSHSHTAEGIEHLNSFTKGSRRLTRDLLNHHTQGKDIPEDSSRDSKNLDKHSFVPAKHDFNTYSGVGFNIDNVKPVGKSKSGNKVYHQPTYMSSSIDKKVARTFADDSKVDNELEASHILQWHHKKGDLVGVVGNHSKYPFEHEVLVPRTESADARHHIEHLGTDTHRDEEGDIYKVHHVRRIPESEIVKD